MGQCKYSLILPKDSGPFIFNAYGRIPDDWNSDIAESVVTYNEARMFADYDRAGFDRNGYTEDEYTLMDQEDFENIAQ